MERTKTGIPGLDELLFGGIPKGSNVLIAGGAGTGKTILATQFLYNGALKYGEPGVFVTLEGNVRDIAWNMESFQWDIKALQDQGMFTIYRLGMDFIKDREMVEDRLAEQLREIEKEVEEIQLDHEKRLRANTNNITKITTWGGCLLVIIGILEPIILALIFKIKL